MSSWIQRLVISVEVCTTILCLKKQWLSHTSDFDINLFLAPAQSCKLCICHINIKVLLLNDIEKCLSKMNLIW